jgi:uncharacterized membrane protein
MRTCHPRSAAIARSAFAGFCFHEHFLHDLGAFQVGIGATPLLALLWRDALTVALTGFLAANTLHAVSHAIDLDRGGRTGDLYAIGAASLLVAVALVLRMRQRGAPTPVPDSRQAQPR